jgi:hypothetical protein
MSDTEDSIEREIAGGDYGPGVFDEPSTYRPEKGDDEAGLSSTLAADTDVEQLVDGGPPPAGGGALTTTGGTAGPNSFRSHPRTGPGVANTTTGDATTGALNPPADGYTSDNTSSAG